MVKVIACNMSYVEHGPRIFLTGRPSNNIPLTYGNYVLPKKRLEGRLKVYDSCSDIRAWSPNPIECSQYFRELTEHAAPPGKIIPFNVVIENIIGLTSQAQNELEVLRQELNKYKSLKLTAEQEKYLQTFDDKILTEHLKEKYHDIDTLKKQSLKDDSKIINKSTSLPHLNSYLSIQINPEINFHYTDRHYQNLSLFSHVDSVSCRGGHLLSKLKSIYVSSNIDNAERNKYKDMESDLTNLEDKDAEAVCLEYADISVQVIWDLHDIGTQTDCLTAYITSSETKVESQLSICKYDNESKNNIIKGFSIESYIETESECSSIIESDFDTEAHERSHKEIIIQKDSEIIALKNELGVKEAEVEELKEVNRKLEIMLKKKDENLNIMQGGLKILQERFMKLNEQRNDELTNLEKKLYTNACIMEQLKVQLNKKFEVTCLQSQEIEKLRLHLKENATLLLERDALMMEKVKEMERLSKEAENCRDALDQLKEALYEKDELQKRNQEQNCILADQEDEIKRLLILIQDMSSNHNDQEHRMTGILEELQAKIIEKDNTISKYEEQLHCLEQEINDFTIKLKNNLNNLEEFKLEYEDIYNHLRCEHDTCERTKRTLCTVSALMEEIQKSKIEDKESLQQIRTAESISACHLNYYCNSCSSLSQVDESNIIMVKQIQTSQRNLLEHMQCDYIDNETVNNKMMHEYTDVENHSNKDVSEPDSWNSAKTEVSILTLNNSINIETTIVEEVSRSLVKIRSLMEQLQVYADKERPSLIKQIRDLYSYLMDNKSVILWSPDTIITKQEISELYDKHKQQYGKHKSCIATLDKDLRESAVTDDFIKILLDRHLQEIIRHDEYIDKIFATQFKRSIKKINELSMALQGAGDQRTQIVKEVEKKEQEILEKDTEIARLKEQVQMGEGDCIRPGNSEWNVIKDNFRSLHFELNQKDQLIQELKDELQSNNLTLSMHITECNKLKEENKSLCDNKNVLLMECNTKNNELKERHDEINRLIKEIENLKESIQITNSMEKEMEELKIKLNILQEENTELKKKLGNANELISVLKDKKEKDRRTFALKHTEYETLLTEKQNLINNIENENSLINEKLQDAENKILSLNETISSLREQNNEMKLLDILRIDTTRIENDIKKLEIKSSKCRSDLLNYENINKENELKLIAFTKENDIIKKHIEILKDKLSKELAQEFITNDELKSTLHNLPNELYNKIINLKKQLSQSDQYYSIHKLHKDMDNDSEDEQYKSKQIENENTKQHLLKIRNLIHEIENKDLDIENLINRVNCLSIENDDLNQKLKYHKENYEGKLAILKRKYDSSVSALHKKHRENIEHLKMNFEEINGERIIFDSESWLQSLSIKELRDVYNRIFLLMNKLDINNDNKAMVDLTNKEGLYGTIQNFSNKYENSRNEDTLMEMQYDQIESRKEEMHNIKLQNVKLKDHNDFSKTLIPEEGSQDKNKNKETILRKTAWEKTMFFDLTRDTKKSKYDSNSRGHNSNKEYASKEIMSIPTTINTMEANTIDMQRKNFIYQCSVYHKKSNNC